MKIKIRTWLISILLFGLSGCDACDVGQTWQITILNNLSHPIYVTVIFVGDRSSGSGLIMSGEEKMVSQDYIFENPEAHKGISKISIFSEDRTPLIILQDIEMDEYVIFTGASYGGGAYRFRLEIEEELIGIGLDKVIDFEEEFPKETE